MRLRTVEGPQFHSADEAGTETCPAGRDDGRLDAPRLANVTGRPVLDKTGLTGKYDYKLEYAPEDNSPDADSTGPSIFTAVQEQFGLKLESAKGPVEIFVIDHVERPSGN